MNMAAIIALTIKSLIDLAREHGVSEADVKDELLKLRGESQAAHEGLQDAIADALKEGNANG